MNIEHIKKILKSHGIHPNKTYGQNFLMNEIILQDMVDSVPLEKGDAVLEIGPGIGNLTKRLLDRVEFLLSVEKDKSFIPVLRALKKDHKNFRYEIEDILKFNFQEALASSDYHVVANIPYYITGKIIQIFLQAQHKPKTITILVQKEVAENIIATPGKMNLLAISVQIFAQSKILFYVPARDFYPAPKVDSAVIQISLSPQKRFEVGDEKFFFRILRACFAGKRKQIHNTLENNLDIPKDVVQKILKTAGIEPTARPQELGIDQWIKLVKEIEKN